MPTRTTAAQAHPHHCSAPDCTRPVRAAGGTCTTCRLALADCLRSIRRVLKPVLTPRAPRTAAVLMPTDIEG